MKKLLALFLVFAVSVGFGCKPGPKMVADEEPISPYAGCHPYDLRTQVDDGQMTVIWKTECDQTFSGYRIYISEDPVAKLYPGEIPSRVESFNHAVFAGDLDPTDGIEHFEAGGLKNGQEYFVSVRLVYPDRSMSKPSNEVRSICGPRGEIEMGVRYRSEEDGFFFGAAEFVAAESENNDLYYHHKDGVDYLGSPSHLDAFLNYSRLMVLPFKGELHEFADKLAAMSNLPSDERVVIKPGQWVWVVTAKGHHALVRVDGFVGSGEDRRVKLNYAFVPSSDYSAF